MAGAVTGAGGTRLMVAEVGMPHRFTTKKLGVQMSDLAIEIVVVVGVVAAIVAASALWRIQRQRQLREMRGAESFLTVLRSGAPGLDRTRPATGERNEAVRGSRRPVGGDRDRLRRVVGTGSTGATGRSRLV